MFLGIVARASRHGITSSLLKWLVVLSFPAFFRFAAGLGSKGEDTILSHLQCIQRRILGLPAPHWITPFACVLVSHFSLPIQNPPSR